MSQTTATTCPRCETNPEGTGHAAFLCGRCHAEVMAEWEATRPPYVEVRLVEDEIPL